jgi:hypothetical protein
MDMDTQNVEIRALLDDELDAVAGGEPISEAVGFTISLAHRIINAINYGFNYLNIASYLDSFGKGVGGGLGGLLGSGAKGK